MAIDLYSMATPNGQKIAIALEELQLQYSPHSVNIFKGEQREAWFRAINPNCKIPVIVDDDGPDGETITLYESGAILLYLAEKCGALLGGNDFEAAEIKKWLFWQAANVGPTFGKYGHFSSEDASPDIIEPFRRDARKLCAVLDDQLAKSNFVIGDQYSIADIAIYPWVDVLDWGYQLHQDLGIDKYSHLMRWYQQCLERPSSIKARVVTPIVR